jgi:nucleoside-diphosphate-sugar epimerase
MNQITGSKALVTGANGFVGSHLTRMLLRQGAKVRVLVRNKELPVVKEFASLGAEVFTGDLRDAQTVKNAASGIDYVFHIGAIFREAKFPDEVYFDINLGGTRNVITACRESGVRRLLYCSTNGVHGGHSESPVSEDAPFAPSDVYQQSKAAAEREVANCEDLDFAIIRPAMIWGEGDLRFLKLFRGVSRRRLPIIGDGKSWTHWIDAEDLAQAFILAAVRPEASRQAYLIAGNRPVPLEYVYQTIAKLAGVKVLPFKIPALPIQLLGSLVELLVKPLGIEPPLHRRRADFFIKHRIFDTSKARRELGFCPRGDFEEECERVFRWYQAQGYL